MFKKTLMMLCLFSFPLMAQTLQPEPYEPYERSFTPPDNTTTMGIISVQNGNENTWVTEGVAEDYRYDLETEWGVVTFKVNKTKNNLCDIPCPDTWSVLSVPEGYIVRPEEIIIPEGGWGYFEMFQFNGM